MFCRNCGTKLGDNARFCPQCGTPVAAAAATLAAAPAVPVAATPAAAPVAQPVKKKKTGLIVGGLICTPFAVVLVKGVFLCPEGHYKKLHFHYNFVHLL